MNYVNQMQDRILSTLRDVVDAWELEWVEIVETPCQGIVRVLESGQFRTLLKIEYEFQSQRCRLLIYKEGKHIAGRCSIDYDDGAVIEQTFAQFRRLCPDGYPRSSRHDAMAAAVDMPVPYRWPGREMPDDLRRLPQIAFT